MAPVIRKLHAYIASGRAGVMDAGTRVPARRDGALELGVFVTFDIVDPIANGSEPTEPIEDPSTHTSSPISPPSTINSASNLEASTTPTASSSADSTPISEPEPTATPSSSDTNTDTYPSTPSPSTPTPTADADPTTLTAITAPTSSSSVPDPSFSSISEVEDGSGGTSSSANPLKPSTSPLEPTPSPSPNPTSTYTPTLADSAPHSDPATGTDGGVQYPSNENTPSSTPLTLTAVPSASQAPISDAVMVTSATFITPTTRQSSNPTPSPTSYSAPEASTASAPSSSTSDTPPPPPAAVTTTPQQVPSTAAQGGESTQVPGTSTPDPPVLPSTSQTPSDPDHLSTTSLLGGGEGSGGYTGSSGDGSTGVVGTMNGAGTSTRAPTSGQASLLLSQTPSSVVSPTPTRPGAGAGTVGSSEGGDSSGTGVGPSETGTGSETGGYGPFSSASISYNNDLPSIASTSSQISAPTEIGATPTAAPAVTITSTILEQSAVTRLPTPALDLVNSRPKPGAPSDNIQVTTVLVNLPAAGPSNEVDSESSPIPTLIIGGVHLSQGSSSDTSHGQIAVANSGSPDSIVQVGDGPVVEPGGRQLTSLAESVTSTLTSTYTSFIPVKTTTDAMGHVETSFTRITGTSTVVTVVPGPKGSGILADDGAAGSGGMQKGAIGGAVAGVVALLIGIVVVLVWVRRRKWKREVEVCKRLFESTVTTAEPSNPTSPSRAHINPILQHTTTYRDSDLKRPPTLGTVGPILTHYSSPTLNENQARRIPPPTMESMTPNLNPFADPSPTAGRVWQRATYPAHVRVRSKLGMESVTVANSGLEDQSNVKGNTRESESQKAIVWWDEKVDTSEEDGSMGDFPEPPPIVVARGPTPVYGPALPPAPPVVVPADPFADPMSGASTSTTEQLQDPFDDLLAADGVKEGRKSTESRVSVMSTASGRHVVPGYAV